MTLIALLSVTVLLAVTVLGVVPFSATLVTLGLAVRASILLVLVATALPFVSLPVGVQLGAVLALSVLTVPVLTVLALGLLVISVLVTLGLRVLLVLRVFLLRLGLALGLGPLLAFVAAAA